jgi:hypothetical protein
MLDEKRLAAIPLLLAGKKYQEVANELGIARETIWTWRKEPEFLAEYNKQRQEIDHEVKHLLVGLLRQAIEVLQRDMDGKTAWSILSKYLEGGFPSVQGETDANKIEKQQKKDKAFEEMVSDLSPY